MNQDPLIFDVNKPQESNIFLPHAPLRSSQEIGWKGLVFQNYQHPSHEVPEFVMRQHLILVGMTPGITQESRIDGKLYHRISRDNNEALIVPAEVTSSAVWTKEAKFSVFILCPRFVREVAHESFDPDCVELIPQFAVQDPLIHQIGLSLKADIEAGYPTGKLFGESAATMLAARLLQQYSVNIPKQYFDEDGLSTYTLRQVLDYIRVHLSEDLAIADLAQVAGMSYYYFMRLFKKSMHVTARQYIIQQRIDRAKELLRSPELDIAEISLQCGFANQSHFTRVFRQATEITPKAYRQDFR
jgi:AraC family transcriptional regulator